MKRALVFLCLIIAVGSLGTALAGIGIQGPLVVEMDDGRGASCLDASAACVADVNASGNPGSWVIDARQRYERIAIAINVSERSGGLLPAYALALDGDGMRVSYAIIDSLMDTYAELPQDRPDRDAAGLTFNRTEVSAYAYGPPLFAPTEAPRNESYGIVTDGHYVSHDQLGPANAGLVTSSDIQLAPSPNFICNRVGGSPECFSTVNGTRDSYLDNTPNLVVGMEWEDVAVATDPEWLPSDNSSRSGASSWNSSLSRNGGLVPLSRPNDNLSPDRSLLGMPGGPPGPGAIDFRPQPTRGPSAPLTPAANSQEAVRKGSEALVIATAIACAIAVILGVFYSRFHQADQAIGHPARALIYKVVAAQGSVPMSELRASLGVSRTTLLHHLLVLERLGIIRCHRVHGRVIVSAVGDASRAEALSLNELLRHPSRGPIVRAILASGGRMTRSSLHEAVGGMPLRTRNHTLKRLTDLKLVAEEEIEGTRFVLLRR